MADLHSITKFKEKILELILSDQQCVDLIAGEHVEVLPAKSLRYRNVFPYAREPEAVSDAKTFVCFEINLESAYSSTTCMYEMQLWVFTHYTLAMVEGQGCRVDLLSARINDLLLGNPDFGIGKLTINTSYRFSPAYDWTGRITEYNPYDFITRK